jgi:HNH endonuclease
MIDLGFGNRPRPCERLCKGLCGEWKHYSRFRSYRNNPGRKSTVSTVSFSPICRDCEQKTRNEKKNTDRPRAIIEQRARSAAAKTGTNFEFFWTDMNYRALVPVLRAMMDEGLCLGCGHKFQNERDIQIEHLEPPRSEKDWSRFHTRNLRLACGSCNRTKSKKPFAQWLDEQEGARLSNLAPAQRHEIVCEQTEMFPGMKLK